MKMKKLTSIALVAAMTIGTFGISVSGDAPGNGQEAIGSAESEIVLWNSELIEPGEEVGSITLNKELESGEYPAIL